MARRRPNGKEGRPCPYMPFVVTTRMVALARGEILDAAADAAGIGTTTPYRWLAPDRPGDAGFDGSPKPSMSFTGAASTGGCLTTNSNRPPDGRYGDDSRTDPIG